MCIRQTIRPLLAACCKAPGCRKAHTSLMISAPALAAADMICGLLVSIESGISENLRIASISGIVRRISSSIVTGTAPGLVDSPPISRISAPSSINRRACSCARFASAKSPPSEKESGVILITPIMFILLKSGCIQKRPGSCIAPRP